MSYKDRETAEEKRARRLKKKLDKEAKHKKKYGWNEEVIGYSNMDNPFGDSSLTQAFVWNKKLEKEGMTAAKPAELEQIANEKRLASKVELGKVKKSRDERERGRAERAEMRDLEAREKEAAQFQTWSEQEQQFHLEQAKLRSKIRIEESRAKPIDLIARYVSDDINSNMEIEMHDPYVYFKGLSKRDLEDLLADVKVYRDLEKGKNDEYWRDITIVAENELEKLRRVDPDKAEVANSRRREDVKDSVRKDINKILKGKTYHQLALLETQVKAKIKRGEQGVDIGFWEALLAQLIAQMAKTRLTDRHQEMLRKKFFKMKQEQMVDAKPLFPSSQKSEDEPGPSSRQPGPSGSEKSAGGASSTTKDHSLLSIENAVGDVRIAESKKVDADECVPGTSAMVISQDDEKDAETTDKPGSSDNMEQSGEAYQEDAAVPWEELSEEERREQLFEDYREGAYSPVPVDESTLELGTEVLDPVEDTRRLEFARMQFTSSGRVTSQQDAALEARARAGMNDDEVQFSVEAALEPTTYLWSDKYRPRKPRYFNRVHTGFEWNKYNQTHYDLDNPPPKIVQGYKFNIFYPDLLDPSNPPTFQLIQEENPDFATLRFVAGPPYEDVAFKVVNREWEISHKKGYRCQFQNGIFQLWYHFKKYRYRR